MQPIVKFANGNQRSLKQMKRVIDYVLQPSKTSSDLVYGNGVFVDNAFDHMLITKELSNQLDGRQYIHWITSFHPDDGVSPELAHELGKEFAAGFNDFQWLMATHTDRNHVHNHYVMNTINCNTGKKFTQSRDDLQRLKNSINRLYELAQMANIPIIMKEEEDYKMNWYEDDYDYYDKDSDEELDFTKKHKNKKPKHLKAYDYDERLARVESCMTDMSQSVTMMSQCMVGLMQMCNPHTLSNVISSEVSRQLDARFLPQNRLNSGSNNHILMERCDEE